MEVLTQQEIIEAYTLAGYDPIPVEPNSKKALVNNWETKPIEKQWRVVNSQYQIGLRCGSSNGLVVLDFDNKNNAETSNNGIRYLAGLGIQNYPLIKTPSGGFHVYLSLRENIAGNYKLFLSSFGTGEFRFGNGAYVVASPSKLGHDLVSGDFRYLPQIAIRDLAGIIQVENLEAYCRPAYINDFAWELLKGEHKDELIGEGKKYASRSEYDQALVTSLVLTGNSEKKIFQLFEKFPTSGRYEAEQQRHTEKNYLETSYRKAQKFTQTDSATIQTAKQLKVYINSIPWQGRTGNTDKAVLLGHVQIMCRSGKITYGASVRELAEQAKIKGLETITRANSRLIKLGYCRESH